MPTIAIAGCALFGAAAGVAAIRNSFPLPDIGTSATADILHDRVLACTLHRFTLTNGEDDQYAALVDTISAFMSLITKANHAGTWVGFQFRATRLVDDAVRIATSLRSGADVDVKDLDLVPSPKPLPLAECSVTAAHHMRMRGCTTQ